MFPYGKVLRTLDDGHPEETLTEELGRDERVAAVVTGAGENEDVFRCLANELRRQRGGGRAGALHERGCAAEGGFLDAADVGREVDRTLAHLARRYFFAAPVSRSGSQVASPGNAMMIKMHASMRKKNGSEARAT